MKKLLIIALLFVGCSTVNTWHIIFPENIQTITIELPELSQEEIYDKSFLWLEMTFSNPLGKNSSFKNSEFIKEIKKNELITIKGRHLRIKRGHGRFNVIVIIDIKSKIVKFGIKKIPQRIKPMSASKEFNASELEQSYKYFLKGNAETGN